MRIHDAYRQSPAANEAPATRPTKPDVSQTSPDSGAAAPPVTVTVSDKAKELASQSADGSTAKVEALKGAIADGTFKINAQAIAKRIVDGG